MQWEALWTLGPSSGNAFMYFENIVEKVLSNFKSILDRIVFENTYLLFLSNDHV